MCSATSAQMKSHVTLVQKSVDEGRERVNYYP